LNRKSRDFTERDRSLLSALRPHLIAAAANAAAYGRLQMELTQLQNAMAGLGRALIVLDREAHPRRMSASALSLLMNYFPAEECGEERLPDALARWLNHCAATACNEKEFASPVVPLLVEGKASRLKVRLIVWHQTQELLLALEEQRKDFPLDELCALGLTKRETEVLKWVAAGKTNSETATLCAISERTVEKHLERIFEKLGVETRTAAARRALELGYGHL
jgi:DNA-binding CsgD family transcriptional regulator